MATVFKKIKSQKISEKIAGQIRTLIKDGQLQPGEKLPPERTLAETLNVGRPSLREAISMLETQGFVETRKRQGIYVCSLSNAIISDPLRQILGEDKDKLLQLYEVRRDIELASAFAAAEYRTQSDLAKMEQILDKMEKDSKKPLLGLYDDLDFHLTIARSGQNIFRSHILKNIFDISDEHLQYIKGIMVEETSHILRLLDQHQKIFSAIVKQDPLLSRSMMEEHLVWVEKKWKIFMEAKGYNPVSISEHA